MNKIYKVIWSKAKHTYVVASEIAKGHTKGETTGKGLKKLAAALLVAAALMGPNFAWAEEAVTIKVEPASGESAAVEVYTKYGADKAISTNATNISTNATNINTNTTNINGLTTRVNALESSKTDTALHISSSGDLIVGTKENQTVKDMEIRGKLTSGSFSTGFFTSTGDVTVAGKMAADGVTDETTKDGTYIKQNNTVGKNLGSLDTQVKANADAINEEARKRKYSVTNLENADKQLQTNIDNEAVAREAKDNELNERITNEANAIHDEIKAGDEKLDTRITNVKEYLENQTSENYVSKTDAAVQDAGVVKADKKIGENVTALGKGLYDETAARIGADAAQDKVIKGVNDNLVSSVNTINKNIGTITDQLNKNDLAEAQTRAAADQTLQKNIDANAGNIAQSKQDIADIQDTLKKAGALATKAATEAATQAASDATAAAKNANDVADGLKDRVDLISNNLNVTSESDLIKKDQSVGQNLTNVDTALHKEIAARIGADKAQDKVIQTVNDNLVNSVNTINKNVADGFTALNQADANEATARKDADTKLDTRITNVKEYLQNETEKNYVSKGMYNRETSVADGAFVKEGQTVGQNLNAVDKGLNDEIAARIGADKAQDAVIQTVNQNVAKGFNDLNQNIGKITDQLNKNDLAEANARDVADQKLQGNIDAEATARDAADKAEAKARQADVSRLDNKIHDVSKEVDTVGALSMAMSGLHPLSYDEGDARFQLSAAVGTYDGTEALALGGFYHFNRDSMLSVGVATDLGADEHRMGANVGYTRRIGQGGHVSRPSEGTVSDIMKDIKNLEQKQAKLEQENEQLKQQLAALNK